MQPRDILVEDMMIKKYRKICRLIKLFLLNVFKDSALIVGLSEIAYPPTFVLQNFIAYLYSLNSSMFVNNSFSSFK